MSDRQDVVTVLRNALEIVAEAGVPDELQAVAFAQAIDMIRLRQRGPTDSQRESPIQEPLESVAADKMAKKFGIRPDLLDYAYDTKSDCVDLILPRSKLPRQKSPAMKVIALLVTASRQAAGLEDWTHVSVIRDVCRQFGVLDAANFATEVASLGDVFVVRGKGQSREFKVTRHGYEEAGQEILRLTSPDQRG